MTILSSSSVEGSSQSKVILITKFSGNGTGGTEHNKEMNIYDLPSNIIKISTICIRFVLRKEVLESCMEFVMGARVLSV